MDPLSNLLRIVRLDGAFFYPVEAAGTWHVFAVAATERAPRILPDSEHLIGYHIVTAGRCWCTVEGEPPVELRAGEAILLPHGDAHTMTSHPNLGTRAVVYRAAPARFPQMTRLGGEGAPSSTLLCGFLGCDRRPFNPLLSALPRVMHLRGLTGGWAGEMSRRLMEESRLGRAGADEMLTRLAELMFIEALRHHLEAMPPGQSGWLAGLRDELVGRALGLLHADPSRNWTIDSLAKEANASRSNLARRFTQLVGQPPMQYLTRWRIQVAANLLREGTAKIAAIAAAVGYESEAAFSRAFKEATGSSPGAWRTAHRSSGPA